MTPYIAVLGNPIDGFTHYGPFETQNDAIDWAVVNGTNLEWWTTPLYIPTNDEE